MVVKVRGKLFVTGSGGATVTAVVSLLLGVTVTWAVGSESRRTMYVAVPPSLTSTVAGGSGTSTPLVSSSWMVRVTIPLAPML